MTSTSCSSCSAAIFFARTPIDLYATADGTIGLDGQGRAIVNPVEDDRCGPERYRPHWSTCTNPGAHRRPRGKR